MNRVAKLCTWGLPAAALLLAAMSGGALAENPNNEAKKAAAAAKKAEADAKKWAKKDISLNRTGGFIIGGKHFNTNPAVTNRTLSCDHGYVEYFIPSKPRQTSIVLWHSSSAQVWQNRWDGGEGYKSMLLRRQYPVYIWDGPRVGRANWSCEAITTTPSSRDQGNFTAWNFGPAAPAGLVPAVTDWWPGEQFPLPSATVTAQQYEDFWWNATGARYEEFDIGRNIDIETNASAVAADSGKLGHQIVYLTNSAGGLRSMVTTSKTTGNNIAGIVTYESIGYVFPLTTSGAAVGLPMPATLCNMSGAACAFGPIGIPEEDFKKLAKLKKIQFVWGDNRLDTYTYVVQSRQAAALINAYGGHAEVLKLGDDAGLKGSTHIPFMDMDNVKVLQLLEGLLKTNQLDGYANKKAGTPTASN